MNLERMYTVIIGPHVSEKTTLMGENDNQYAFRVAKDATKLEIKEAVESIFNVVVDDLQVLNVKGKVKKNVKGRARRKLSWKKAYVRLETGHEIDFADIG